MESHNSLGPEVKGYKMMSHAEVSKVGGSLIIEGHWCPVPSRVLLRDLQLFQIPSY